MKQSQWFLFPFLRIFLFLFVAFNVFLVGEGTAGGGMVNVKSPRSVSGTAERLQSLLRDKGMTVFLVVDHAAGARKAGLELRPTSLVIFGNAKVGTPLMRCQQTVAMDLPQKALIWEDAQGQVWLSYNDPQYLAERHGVPGCEQVLRKISGALANFARAATMP